MKTHLPGCHPIVLNYPISTVINIILWIDLYLNASPPHSFCVVICAYSELSNQVGVLTPCILIHRNRDQMYLESHKSFCRFCILLEIRIIDFVQYSYLALIAVVI